MDVLARPAAGRDVAFDDFADITPAVVTAIEWAEGGLLRVSFDGTLGPAQQLAVRLRITSSDVDEEKLRVAAAAFLAIDSPTSVQTLAQVKRLTRLLLTLDDSGQSLSATASSIRTA